jgi:FAD/FMN-containing dehydrogenase
MLSHDNLKVFRESIRGASFCPGDAGYDVARTIPNAMIDRRPAVIVRCAGAADVVGSVRFAREHGALVSVRGGGHSVAGKSVCDGGVMIDLSAMKGIRVDATDRTARAEPGLTLGEFDRETQAFGLATALGVVSKTGIAGLTLGGGYGHLHGKYGLALDNVLSLDAVLADGRLVTATPTENPDLYWGLRGSGGNLGVVTSLLYRVHEVGPVLGGGVFFAIPQMRDVLRFIRGFAAKIPDELAIQGIALTHPEIGPVFGVAVCYCGPISEGEKALKPLRSFGKPVADIIGPMPLVQLQGMFDPFFPPGRYTYVKSSFVQELTDAAIDVLAEFAASRPSPLVFAPGIEHWHGAATRVGPTETAFPHRTHQYNFMAWSTWTETADTERHVQWTRQFWEAMKPHLAPGSYVNYLSDDDDGAAKVAFGPNYDRLLALKNKYDPTNLFRMNHNIRPTA